MTDKDVMLHRFFRENINVSTGEFAKRFGIPRKQYEEACKRAMKEEQMQNAKRKLAVDKR